MAEAVIPLWTVIIKSEIYIFLAPPRCSNDLVALGYLRLLQLVHLVGVVVLVPSRVLIEDIERGIGMRFYPSVIWEVCPS